MEPEDQVVLAPIPLWGHRTALSVWGVRAEKQVEAGLGRAECVVAGPLNGSQDPALSLRDGSSRWVCKYLETSTPALRGVKASSPAAAATMGGFRRLRGIFW